ncbi:fatty acid CoA ligase family protein [Limnoglobus roseus]|uniref:Peptide synthase n=1 Tax=Limnoglobus roseus TaxID=2598579 RepID=A0A5C1A7I6_9BACT|nr:fatty acid CoA ligase family protein [Limnoglobus roseus]QEL15141.1 peptide synthase [Limnoglobus roseus]
MTTPDVNVSSHLAILAAVEPARVALHSARAGTHRTFSQLHSESDATAHGLTALGIGPGTRVALMVPPSLEFFSLTFALLKAAAVPVLIDPGMGIRRLGDCLNEAEPEVFIGIPKAHVARRLLGWGRRTIRTTVNVGRGRFFCTRSSRELPLTFTGKGEYARPPVTANDPAAILFTSGSTGLAKGAVYTHGIFTAQVEMLKAEYGIAPGEIDLCTFPLFALFGPALGMTCVIPDMNPSRPATIDPPKTLSAVRRFAVTNLFGSPAVIRRLGDSFKEGADTLTSVKRVLSAGAPASPHALERFSRLLPDGVQIFTPYGATEALPVANIGSDEILAETRRLTERGHGVCVGRPFAGMTVRIIRISDEPIAEWDESLCVPDGEVGEIVVRGPVVTKQYWHRDAATKLAKITDPATGEVLHRMGDVGYFDDRGRLWFCGRKSQRVVTPHGTLFTDMVEPIFNTEEGVSRTALVGVVRDGVTHPVLCVEPTFRTRAGLLEVSKNLKQNEERGTRFDPRFESNPRGYLTFHLYAEVKRITPTINAILIHPKFPVDVRHNSKIFREKLAEWADGQLPRKWNGGRV